MPEPKLIAEARQTVARYADPEIRAQLGNGFAQRYAAWGELLEAFDTLTAQRHAALQAMAEAESRAQRWERAWQDAVDELNALRAARPEAA